MKYNFNPVNEINMLFILHFSLQYACTSVYTILNEFANTNRRGNEENADYSNVIL